MDVLIYLTVLINSISQHLHESSHHIVQFKYTQFGQIYPNKAENFIYVENYTYNNNSEIVLINHICIAFH